MTPSIDKDIMEKARAIADCQHFGSQWKQVRANYTAGLHDDDAVVMAAYSALQAVRNEERELCAIHCKNAFMAGMGHMYFEDGVDADGAFEKWKPTAIRKGE